MQQKISSLLSFFQHPQLSASIKTKHPETKKQFAYVQNQETKPYFYRLPFPVSGDGIAYRVEKHDMGLFHSSKRIFLNNVDYHHHVYK